MRQNVWRLCFSTLVFALVQRISYADEERARAHAAPTGFNAIDVGNGEMKDFLKIPGGYRDGFQKVIFNEVGQVNVPASPDLPSSDRFGAYDDSNVITAEDPLFIPLPYRNETAEEKADRERKEKAEKDAKRGRLRPIAPTAPQTLPPTRTIISNAFNGQQVTIRPTAPSAQPPRPIQQTFNPQPVAQPRPTFVAPQQPAPQIQPSPSNSFQPPIIPNQPQTRPPFVPQTRPNTFVQPQRPSIGFTPQPPRQPQFNSLPPQTTFRPQPTFTQTPSTFAPVRTTQAPQRPSQPAPRPVGLQSFRPPFQQPSTTTLSPNQQFRQLRPFRPSAPPPQQPSTSFTQPPVRSQSNLRTGTCSRTIYYKAQEATQADVSQPFSHFAVVVSVDQCARTLFEFNAAQAVFDPTNRHCQFNPSTKFTVPQFCEQWPNPLYRFQQSSNHGPFNRYKMRYMPSSSPSTLFASISRDKIKALGISQVQFGPLQGSTLARRIHGVIVNENFSQQTTMNTDQILNKHLEAARVVDFSPSITTTNLEHLEPMKSSSAANDESKKVEEAPKSENSGAEKSLEFEEQLNEDKNANLKTTIPEIKLDHHERPFRQNAAIIVHKIHPISSVRI
ncbi:hypothetical protein M3Y97_00482000 [Aphelenchoides bicaudatus]|nr:hypothetical protein M3Y97_00482000 [Aphelenchoides bicaudatus]